MKNSSALPVEQKFKLRNMRSFHPLFLLCLIFLSAQALEPLKEQMPLSMATPNTAKDKSVKWIPLTSNPQEASKKTTSTPAKSINDAIKTQIQKTMQTLLKPSKDEEADQ